jgi:hypothetical protein
VRQKLNFSHPTKELIWVIQPDANVVGGANRWVDFTDNGTGPNPYAGNDPLVDAKIQLNTHDRITTRTAAYWNLVQPYNHHTRIPSTGIYLYSFALEPLIVSGAEKHLLTGIRDTPVNKRIATLERNIIVAQVQMLVILSCIATLSNCGKLLRVLRYHLHPEKDAQGTRLIAGSNGKNARNWTIRSQISTSAVHPDMNMKQDMRKVQRLDGSGSERFSESRRRSKV